MNPLVVLTVIVAVEGTVLTGLGVKVLLVPAGSPLELKVTGGAVNSGPTSTT